MADRFDLDAIEADDALLDLLAAGGESARSAGEHDPAVALLADLRLAVEVEDELPVETIDDPESFLARCAALNPMTDPFARKMATRGLAFGVAAVAALSVSGVAAAVTGDPLSPYEKVIEKMVDAVRPQTSFPKEDVDGSPVVDRSKIVKVSKDFKAKAGAEHATQSGKDSAAGDEEQAQDGTVKPEPLGSDGKPLAIRDDKDVVPISPETTEEPVKPTTEVTATPKPTDDKTDEPTGTKTDEPTDTKTENPPDTPPSTPTEEPTEPATPTPTPTDTTTATPPPTNGETNTGDGGTGTGDNTVSDPTGTPSAGSGDGQTGGEEITPPGSDSTTPAGTDSTGTSDTSGDDTKPSSPVTQVPEQTEQVQQQVEQLVEKIQEVLPTPSGLPVTNESAEQFFGVPDATAKSIDTRSSAKSTKSAKSGKHSSGKVSTGSVRKTYPTGKHSTGHYPEGKHAAIERTHGSTTDTSLLQILEVVNKPIR